MKRRPVPSPRQVAAVLALAAAVLVPSSALAKKPPSGGGGGFSTTSTYVKNYANVLNGVQYDLTPEDVQATSDGGSISLAITKSTSGVGVAWLLKASAVGQPQWQEEVGCLATPPGDYSDELSLQQTADGGYVLAGGTIGCGSGAVCPSTSGIQCGLVEKLDASGGVVWAETYSAAVDGTSFTQIRQTSDGGFVAVGTGTDASQRPGALIVKLDGGGGVQWERLLGPTATSYAELDAVRQTSDGGYVAAGEFNDGSTSSSGVPLMSVLAVKLDSAGNVVWQRGFNDVGSTGAIATEHVHSIVQTADGGYAIGGDWNDSTGPGTCCQGALLLKLTATGSIDWQQAYSGGVYCYFNGFSETCADIGGGVYSVRQTSDGGYVLAGDANLELTDSTPLVPWLARVDGGGALVWQENDYQSNATTGRPLSEYFAASALTAAGPLAVGATENYSNGLGELLGVQTDANGTVASCSQIHPASTLTATSPALAQLATGLTVGSGPVSQAPAPVQVQPTSASATQTQC